jgi:hypothetical protein
VRILNEPARLVMPSLTSARAIALSTYVAVQAPSPNSSPASGLRCAHISIAGKTALEGWRLKVIDMHLYLTRKN